jgi:predicted ATP-grasp superfamily ATP-dependent carboligase
MSRNALAVARSLSDEHVLYGATQRVRAPAWLFRMLATKRFRDIGFHDDPYIDVDAFVASVNALIREHRIEGVIGTGTATTDALIDRQEEITRATGARILAGDRATSLKLTDKWDMTLIARRAGVAMPLTCDVPQLDRLGPRVRAAGISVPFVVKPRRRSAAIGVRFFRDWDAVRAFERVAATSHQVGQEDGYVAQALIEGDLHDGNCVARNGRIVALMSQARVVTAWDFGGGGIINKTHREPEILEAVRRMVETSGFTGIAQFEFIRTGDGAFMLIECNPKIFGTTFLPTAAGINLVKHAVDALLLGRDGPKQEQYEEGLLYRWVFPDCVAYWFTSPLTPARVAERVRKTLSRHGARRLMSNLTLEDIAHQTGNVIGALLSKKKLNRI